MAIKMINESSLRSVADAIRAKSGTSEPLEYPDGFVSAIEDIPTGGGGGSAAVPEKEVNFYDYDGTCVYSYTPAEFAALTEMPANPSHEGLTAQGWNWSLSDAKTYVVDYGMLDVGQMYITDDGKTRIYIHLEQGRTSPMLGVCPNGTVDVDWGDGTEHDTLTGTSTITVKWTPTHNYAAPGDYAIKLTVDGSMGFSGSSSVNQFAYILRYGKSSDSRNTAYQYAIRSILCGSGVTDIRSNAFCYCCNLKEISIPNSVTSIENSAFYYCRELGHITIPNSVRSIIANAFANCSILKTISIPNSVTSIESGSFSGCSSLKTITIPNNVTHIAISFFQSCLTLATVTIPNSVTSIDGNAFQYCYSLSAIHFLSAIPPTVNSSTTFTSLPADCKIYIPTGSLEAYTTATNYPSSSIYTYIEE